MEGDHVVERVNDSDAAHHRFFGEASPFIHKISEWLNPLERSEERRVSIVTGGTPLEAAMKRILVALTGIMLCAATLHSDPALPRQGEEMSATVTDMPETIDMSYANPKTWHRLPSAARV